MFYPVCTIIGLNCLRKMEIADAIYSIKYFLQAIRVKSFQLVELCTTENIL